MVVDRGLPAIDGIDLIGRLRARGIATPILILTARGTLADRVEGLDAGAEDYLVKPFEIDELLARLRALLRRHSDTAAVIALGRRRLDVAGRRVVGGGARRRRAVRQGGRAAGDAGPATEPRSSPGRSCWPRSSTRRTGRAPSTPTSTTCAASSAATSSAPCTALATGSVSDECRQRAGARSQPAGRRRRRADRIWSATPPAGSAGRSRSPARWWWSSSRCSPSCWDRCCIPAVRHTWTATGGTAAVVGDDDNDALIRDALLIAGDHRNRASPGWSASSPPAAPSPRWLRPWRCNAASSPTPVTSCARR